MCYDLYLFMHMILIVLANLYILIFFLDPGCQTVRRQIFFINKIK